MSMATKFEGWGATKKDRFLAAFHIAISRVVRYAGVLYYPKTVHYRGAKNDKNTFAYRIPALPMVLILDVSSE